MSIQPTKGHSIKEYRTFFGRSLLPVVLNMWSVSPLSGAQPLYEDALLSRPFEE